MIFKTDMQHPQDKEIAYLRLIYLLSAAILGFYLARYSFVYDITRYNFVLVPLYLVLLSAPLFFYRTKSLLIAAAAVLGPSYILIFVFIYLAGGITAPGIYWLSTMPIILGFLFGRNGFFIGSSLLVVLTGILISFSFLGLTVNILPDPQTEATERVFQVLLFFPFIIFTSGYFLVLEERYLKQLQSGKKESDLLVKVLMHDFSTPLTILQMESLKLKGLQEADVAKESLQKIIKTIDSMSALLSQLRDLRALNRNTDFYSFELVDLNLAVRDVTTSLASLIAEQRISFNLDIPDRDVLIWADERGLRDIVLHPMFTNAVLSSPLSSWIDIRVYSLQTGEVCLEARDYGAPYTEEQIGAIFSLENKVTKVSSVGDLVYSFPLMKSYLDKIGAVITVHSLVLSEEKKGNLLKVIFPAIER